jgi:hypothetical protein
MLLHSLNYSKSYLKVQIFHLQTGHINLFTVRHDTGRLCHVMNGRRGPVSALSMEHDEKGYFSAGWDGEALVSRSQRPLYAKFHCTLSERSWFYDFPAMGSEHRSDCEKIQRTWCTACRHRRATSYLRILWSTYFKGQSLD